MIVCAGLGAACDRSPNIVWHPTAENAPPDNTSLIGPDSVPAALSSVPLKAWLSDRNLILGASASVQVGPSGSSHEVFSHVADARVSAAGDIFIFDEDVQELRRFSPDGTYLDTLGGVGDGPTEFRYATGFILLEDGNVAVLDRTRLRLFERVSGAWEFLRFVPMPTLEAGDACTFGDETLFLAGPAAGSDVDIPDATDSFPNIHSVDTSDDSWVSFGSGYLAQAAIVRWDMSTGPIACAQRNNTIVFGFALTPLIRAYGRDSGSLLWESRIGDYIQMGIRQRPGRNGGFGVTWYTRRDHDLLARIHEAPSGSILLQTRRYSESTDTRSPRTYLVDATSGAGALISESLPEITSFFDTGYVALLEDPFPRIEIRTYNRESSGL